VATLGPRNERQKRTLLGFSSGGGFTLRFAGGPQGDRFDCLVLVAPQFPHTAPTSRPNAGGWVSVAIPRIIILSILSRIGINAFGGLRVLAMAVDPARAAMVRQTPFYSYRMLQNFTAGDGYLESLKRVRGPVAVFVGGDDEIFVADRYAPLLQRVRPDTAVTIVPGMSHMQMTVKPAAVEVLAASI
jgi:pimeloyl-ACP methyl ester carboxylesterase